MEHTATYSPEDNKLRLYPAYKLDADDYERVKAAGFKWAPKQELFVAPMWTPGREDLLIEMCGEIDDEDKSLVSRAEERADRFEDYSDNRASDAESARKAVSAIADNIPFGQPILVGHHSEKHARRDAQKIENGMRRAVKMWEQAEYWKQRAAGAVRAAKYKERPDVRARRIKGLEADKRKQERATADADKFLKLWGRLDDAAQWKTKSGDILPMIERVKYIANYDHVSKAFSLAEYPAAEGVHAYEGMQSLWSALDGGRITAEQARDIAIPIHESGNAHRARWIAHYENRIAYERAMLEDVGGTVADKTGPEKGGACRAWCSRAGAFSYIVKVNKVSVTLLDNWGNGGENFTRTIPFDKLTRIMTKAEVDAATEAGLTKETPCKTGFYLLQSRPEFDAAESHAAPVAAPITGIAPNAADFDAMRESLRAGVQVVTAPQLFPTPRELAERVADIADIKPGNRVLEPSAGTGALLGALGGRMFGHNPESGTVHAVEINRQLAGRLQAEFPLTKVHCADFLEFGTDDFVPFDRIVMNPPFSNGDDIKHIKHALTMLKPGGKLVAICANGPRQRAELMPIGEWEDLPPGSFSSSGTNVNAALLVVQV
jgi:protein-L-isoaspartate O-methyltransferase